jgi:hypothetical protein
VRAWRIIDLSSPTWDVPRDRANKLLYVSVIKLLRQAQEYRVAQEHHEQQKLRQQSQLQQKRYVSPQHDHSQQAHIPQQMQQQAQAQVPMSFDPRSLPTYAESSIHAGFYLPQQTQQQQPLYVNQGTGLLDDQIGVGVGVNVTQALPVSQQTWYAPIPVQQTHPLSLEDTNMVYGPDETWSEYNNLLKNYSMHGGLE